MKAELIPLDILELDLRRRGLDHTLFKYDEDQPRVPAGNPDGGEWTDGGYGGGGSGGSDNPGQARSVMNYRGIGHVTFAPQGSTNTELIQENKETIDEALNLLPPGASKGLKTLYVTNGSFGPLGAAVYLPPTNKPGYVSDEIMTNQPWLDKPRKEKVQTLVHEFGHRMQNVSHTKVFKEFSRQKLGVHAKEMLGDFYKNYPAKAHAGETFAESFSRYKTGRELPAPLKKFWDDQKL